VETYSQGNKRITLIDLSDCLSNQTSPFEPNPHQIEYYNHEQTLDVSKNLFGLDKEDWPTGHSWAVETVTLSTHSGTHVDAPYHYGPASGGKPAQTIDQVPLRWCYGDGVVLDMTHKKTGEKIMDDDIKKELERIEYQIKPFDIVLIRTDTSKKFSQPGYDKLHPGLSRAGTQFLVENGVRLIGIDAWGLDRPFDVMVKEAKEGNREQLWESHFFGTEKEYLQIERLSNLEAIPIPYGFTVAAFPVKIEAASAGWSRVVAIIEEPV
jgi:kynurenine formamidase